MNKTNAALLLDSSGISYELVQYDVDESDLSASSVAAKKLQMMILFSLPAAKYAD